MATFGTVQKELIKRMADGQLIAPKNKREEDALQRLRQRGYVATDGTEWKLLSTKVAQQIIQREEREKRSQETHENRLANMHPAAREQYQFHVKLSQLQNMRDRSASRIQQRLFIDMIDEHIDNWRKWYILEPVEGGPKIAKIFHVQDDGEPYVTGMLLRKDQWFLDGPYTEQEARNIIKGGIE